MILVDKQIKQRIKKQNMICSGFKPENLHGVSYDILIDSIIIVDSRDVKKYNDKNSYNLRSGETVYVKSDIEIKMPTDCVGRVVERNSVMRTGLNVSGPCYQPGHETRLFLRVQNMSYDDITLYKGQGIAQIMFEKLEMEPDTPYSKEKNSSYQNEMDYTGVRGEWREDWLRQIEKYNKKIEDLENTESRIYGNIITIMGVFITMFTLVMFSYSGITQNMSFGHIVGLDITLTLLLMVLLGAIYLIVNRHKRWSFIVYIIVLVLLVGLAFLAFYMGWILL